MSCVQYEDLPEADLVNMCKEGDSLAFNEIVSRNRETLFNYILNKTKDSSTADDILQITLIKAWNSVHKFEGRARILSWLTKIAFNAYYDYYKKKKKEISLDEALSNAPNSAKQYSPSNEVKLNLVTEDAFRESKIKDLNKKIKLAFDSLSKEHKEVLELRELYGLDCKQS